MPAQQHAGELVIGPQRGGEQRPLCAQTGESRDATYITTHEGKVVYANKAACDLFGYSREELLALDITVTYTNPDDRRRFQNEIEEKGSVQDFEVKLRRKNGTLMDCLLTSTVRRTSDGRTLGYEEIIRDITERKWTKEALWESEERLELAIAGSNGALWDLTFNAGDPPDVIPDEIYLSRRLKGFLGYEDGELSSSTEAWLKRIVPEDIRLLTKSAKDHLEGHTDIYETEFRVRHKSGSVRWISSRGKVHRDETGKPIRWTGIAWDVTDRKRAEEALRESEEKYRTLVENVNIGIYRNTPGPRGRFLQANPAVAKMHGYDSVEEFMEISVSDLYQNPEEREVFVEELVREGVVKNKELRLAKRDGSPIWTSCTARVEYDADGHVKWIDGVIEDITERKRAELALRENERKYRELFESANDILYVHDLDLKLLSVNRAGRELLGYSEEEASSLRVTDMVAPESLDTVREKFQRRIAFPEVEMEAYEIQIMTRQAERLWVEVKGKVITKDSRPVGVFGIARNITARKKADQERKRLQEQLTQSQKIQSIGTLTGGIAHEFNNINAAVIGYLDLTLQTEELSATARRNMEIVRRSAARAAQLTRSLLTFSRKDPGDKAAVNLKDAVEEVLKITANQFASEGIEVVVNHSVSVPPVMANLQMLQSVVMNLAINARHAMFESKEKKLTIQTGLENGGAVIRVKDTGCGIPEEHIPRVFDPFFTTKGALAGGRIYDGKAHGTGLGLSVCHSIVESHGGEIRVESQVGKGTTFAVYLPGLVRPGTARRKPAGQREEEKAPILVVDDEEAIVDLVVNLLHHKGYVADGFTNPQEAMEAIRQKEYDVAFIDLQMPEMPGEHLIRYVNDLPPDKRPLTVVLTGRLGFEEGNRRDLRIFATLSKPFTAQQILKIVEAGLALKSSGSTEPENRVART